MVSFLGRASVAVASTRDERLVPRVHFLSGWSVDPDGEGVTCLVPAAFTHGLDETLLSRGEFALTAEVIGPHETYQFKGGLVEARPAGPADRAVYEACRRRFVEAVMHHLPGRFTEEMLVARMREPALAARFAVREIFIQTPGPAAGRRLFPPEA